MSILKQFELSFFRTFSESEKISEGYILMAENWITLRLVYLFVAPGGVDDSPVPV